MLIPREELAFKFGQAKFDVSQASDRKFLGWVFDQFLYGEVTGIQCGHWLYHSPHLNAATFIAKQSSEELSHVKRIIRILSLLNEKPNAAHPAVRFLSTGMMGGTWGEHVAMEMGLGEGLVLSAFYALADTIDQPEIQKIIESAVKDEERHVAFGEQETQDWLKRYPSDRKLILGLALFQTLALDYLKSFLGKKLAGVAPNHPVLKQFPEFYEDTLKKYELRILRLNLYDKPLRQMPTLEKIAILMALPYRKLRGRIFHRHKLLTDTYLNDPMLSKEMEGF